MYWDCNSAIVFHAFNYTKFNYLGLFLQHYNQDVDHCGHDPTVTIPSQSKLNKVTKLDQKTLVEYNNKCHCEFWVMLIPDCDDGSWESEFLISYPPKYTCSPFGRATRLMVAYDLKQSCFIFVKDYWRPIGSDKEGDTYKILVENAVPHITPFGKGND